MASFNGNIGTPSGGFNLKVEYSISQSISGNYSDITATGYVKRNSSSYRPYNSSSSSSLNINGDSAGYSGSYDLRSDGYKSIVSKSTRVYHNAYGKKGITISFSFNGKLSSYYPNGSISQYITLPTIPRNATTTSAIDFNDEGNPTISFNNPGGFQLQPYLNFYLNGSLIKTLHRPKGNYSSPYAWNLTDEERDELRQLLASNNSCTVNEGVDTYNGDTKLGYHSIGRTFSIVNANPIFNNFEFEDTNETTLALTGNNQNIIKGYSNVKATISTTNKATSLKKATMNKYRFNNGDSSVDITYDTENSVNGTLNKVSNGIFNVYAIDSRNNSTLVTKNANSVIEYTPLTKGNIDIYRANGVSEEVTLKIDGKINLINFGLITNSIKEAKYRYRVSNDSTWSEYNNITLTIDENGNFSYEGLISGDTETLGFNIENSYAIEVYVNDELSDITYTDTFGSGVPNVAFHKNGVGIMGKYDEEAGGLFQIGGTPINDFIVERGNNYVKYNSGIMFQKRVVYMSDFKITSKQGNVYVDELGLGDWDEPFVQDPQCNYSIGWMNTSRTVWVGGPSYSNSKMQNPTSTSAGKIYVYATGSTSVWGSINVWAVGRWKSEIAKTTDIPKVDFNNYKDVI